ncbi:MAG: TetR/AcrR family transcriptional regulator [Arcanobacterium sp.]|nr:TetR/AcrR family transcriptional regulator [Arcanobacterium sp.]MDY5589599.1 TetR/AcrR family transcriptional regulator [Arcanobacterium sp.]
MMAENSAPAQNVSPEKQRSTGMNGRGISTRTKIIEEARRQITENGLKATTAATVAAAVGIPRPLFYHYFSNLDELAEKMLDEIVNSFIRRLERWHAHSSNESIDESLDTIIALWRTTHDENSVFAAQLASEGNTAMYMSFMIQTGDRFARFLTESVVPTFTNRMEKPISHVYETLFSLIIGVNELMRTHPDFSNEEIKHIVAQALRIEDEVNISHTDLHRFD